MATAGKKYSALTQAMATSALFAGIDEGSYEELLAYLDGTVRSYEEGSLLVRIGDAQARVGMVVEGDIEVGFYDESGSLANVTRMRPGDVFAESIACAGVPSPVQALASEDSTVLWLSADRIRRAGSFGAPCSAGCMLGNLVGLLSSKNVFLNRKVHILAQKRLRDRVKLYLNDCTSGSGQQRASFSRSELARYLCVDRSALSRELGRMRDEGIVRLDGKDITVVDVSFLK